MRDEAGFLVALQATPGDNITRLAYADWLDEQGLPGSDFLRLGCQLSALAPGDRDQHDLLLGKLRLASRGLDLDWMAAVSRVPLVDIGLRWTRADSRSEAVPPRERAYLDILH